MRVALLSFVLFATSPAVGSSLFDDRSILEVTLSGPLSSIIRQKPDREEFPFTLAVDGSSFDVSVRLRGNSRVELCRFPPLRLKFRGSGHDGTPFAGQDKLKLVTHCQNGSDSSQDSALNEFAAYRIFNLVSDRSYRVRLLRIHYKDSDDRQRKLEEPHYGFLIESDEELANRLGGTVADVKSIRFGSLDIQQSARMSVFQYVIGNRDWSFVASENDDTCCHNLDLLEVDNKLVPIPYDFDLAALTRPRYRNRPGLNYSDRRKYSGYCRSPVDALDEALTHVQVLKEQISAAVLDVPSLSTDAGTRRATFVAAFFEEAVNKADLLARFERNCVGSR